MFIPVMGNFTHDNPLNQNDIFHDNSDEHDFYQSQKVLYISNAIIYTLFADDRLCCYQFPSNYTDVGYTIHLPSYLTTITSERLHAWGGKRGS